MTSYKEQENMSRDIALCYLREICSTKWEKIIRYCYKTELDDSKTASKKVVHKTAEASEELKYEIKLKKKKKTCT